ncbi:MAG TPA: pyridoxal-phosphate dependent enzyme [Chloroflexota bacterium]|nr:pyridoxal-phosphate dependent enzyme [Chloroflexota bacterium]
MFEGCPNCDLKPIRAPLEVHFDLDAAWKSLDKTVLQVARGSIWRFAPFLPVADPDRAVSLGEGGTPLLHHPSLNDTLGVPNLLLKNESMNPTWSFKDRFSSVAVSVARELGYAKIVASSTGNHGASAAAYAGAAGLRSLVLVPRETPMILRQLIEAYGARAVATEWHGRGGLVTILTRQHGWFPATGSLPDPIGTPFGLEGYKTIGYELVLQSREAPPDYVLTSVGGGDQLYGIYKGLREFRDLGIVSAVPHMVACQAEGASPVVNSFERGLSRVAPVKTAYSIATSTREEVAGDHALRALRESDGLGVRVTEEEILAAMRTLSRQGIAAEAASCIPVAAARKLIVDKRVPPTARIACILTSTGIKWPEQLALLGSEPASVEPTLDALASVTEL